MSNDSTHAPACRPVSAAGRAMLFAAAAMAVLAQPAPAGESAETATSKTYGQWQALRAAWFAVDHYSARGNVEFAKEQQAKKDAQAALIQALANDRVLPERVAQVLAAAFNATVDGALHRPAARARGVSRPNEQLAPLDAACNRAQGRLAATLWQLGDRDRTGRISSDMIAQMQKRICREMQMILLQRTDANQVADALKQYLSGNEFSVPPPDDVKQAADTLARLLSGGTPPAPAAPPATTVTAPAPAPMPVAPAVAPAPDPQPIQPVESIQPLPPIQPMVPPQDDPPKPEPAEPPPAAPSLPPQEQPPATPELPPAEQPSTMPVQTPAPAPALEQPPEAVPETPQPTAEPAAPAEPAESAESAEPPPPPAPAAPPEPPPPAELVPPPTEPVAPPA